MKILFHPLFFLVSLMMKPISSEMNLRGSKDTNILQEFTRFINQYEKTYSNLEEFNHRYEILHTNFQNILSHNFGNHTFSMGDCHKKFDFSLRTTISRLFKKIRKFRL